MAQKIVAVFLMCIVVLAVVRVQAEKEDHGEGPAAQAYKTCINDCEEKCRAEGGGYTFCEMKCDEDCADEELKGTMIH